MKPKPFNKLTAAQKRVAIAKDVIKQIRAGRFIPKSGKYFAWNRACGMVMSKETLTGYKRPCQVCAVGCAVVGGLRLFNGSSFKSMGSDHNAAFHAASKWFSAGQIVAMEAAFEDGGGRLLEGYFPSEESFSILDRADAFGLGMRGTRKLAIKIFTNIIANKGEFVP